MQTAAQIITHNYKHTEHVVVQLYDISPLDVPDSFFIIILLVAVSTR